MEQRPAQDEAALCLAVVSIVVLASLVSNEFLGEYSHSKQKKMEQLQGLFTPV